jgi:hypothetical protein
MKKKYFFFLFIFLMTTSFSQERSFEKNHYTTIGVSNLMNYKVRFRGVGVFMKSKISYSPELNLGYIFDFSRKWRLNTKLNFGVTSYNLNYSYVPEENSIFRQSNPPYELLKNTFTEYRFSYYFSSDIAFQRKFNLQNNNKILLGFGMRLQYYLIRYFILENGSSYYVDSSNPQVEFFSSRFDNFNSSPVNFAGNIELGYIINLKRSNHLKLSFIYNYAFFKRMEGAWEFKNIEGINQGYMFQKPSFFGLALEYQINFTKFLKKE